MIGFAQEYRTAKCLGDDQILNIYNLILQRIKNINLHDSIFKRS